MTDFREKFEPFIKLMKKEGLHEISIKNFEYYYRQLLEGHTGFMAENDIHSVEELPDLDKLSEDYGKKGKEYLSKTVILKLNGGLGTGMGLESAKSLLTVKKGLTFLDIIAEQVIREDMKLLLMNSFATREESLSLLKKYPELWKKPPLDFLQSKVPKIFQKDLTPAFWPPKRELEWCPPGHGDIYNALVISGVLDCLLHEGYEYAFVSNADNLGAVMNDVLLGYFAENKIPFMMEVTDRTEADKKGGHLAKLNNGRFVLRESAQCPTEDIHHFQDITKHKYFNTNNLWINLVALKDIIISRNNIMGLPMIRNSKTIDPRDKASAPVYQLETAMGAAIGVIDGAWAIRVSRERFSPVKTTSDLLPVRSDAYVLTDDFRVVLRPERKGRAVKVSLDRDFYKFTGQLERSFPGGYPSLIECESLTLKGDIKFGRNVVLKGQAEIINNTGRQVAISDNEIIEGLKLFE